MEDDMRAAAKKSQRGTGKTESRSRTSGRDRERDQARKKDMTRKERAQIYDTGKGSWGREHKIRSQGE